MILTSTGATCDSESQSRACSNGTLGNWSGTFTFTSCSASPVLTLVGFPGTFQNDSIGTQARFSWSVPGPGSWPVVRLAYGGDIAELQAWNGSAAATLTSGGVISDHAQCAGDELSDAGDSTGTKFNPGSTSNLTDNDKCGINFSGIPAWSKRFFRVYIESATEKSLSAVRGAGHAPPGMVLVPREDWPLDEFNANDVIPNYAGSQGRAPGGTVGPFDFAIDKYEMSGPLTHCDANNPRFPCSGTPKTTETGFSAKGATPIAGSSWNDYKQACLNRSYDPAFAAFVDVSDLLEANSFSQTVPTPLRKIHMISDMEYYVASKGTPEGNGTACNISGNSLENSGSRSQCVSRFEADAAPITHGVAFNPGIDVSKLYFNSFSPLLQFSSSNSFSHTLQVSPAPPTVGALWAWDGICGPCSGARGGGTYGHSYATVTEGVGPFNASRTSYFIEGPANIKVGDYGGKFGSRCSVLPPLSVFFGGGKHTFRYHAERKTMGSSVTAFYRCDGRFENEERLRAIGKGWQKKVSICSWASSVSQ